MMFLMSNNVQRTPQQEPTPHDGKKRKLPASHSPNKVCKAFLNGHCLGPVCPYGMRHPPCPSCGDTHPKVMCPLASIASAALPGAPAVTPQTTPTHDANTQKGAKGKGGKWVTAKGGKAAKGGKGARGKGKR